MGILNYFPGVPRPAQAKVLLEFEANLKPRTAYVIDGPVALGKSKIALCIGEFLKSWDMKTTIVPPDGYLQKQYEDDAPNLPSVRGAAEKYCATYQRTCDKVKKMKKGFCDGCCQAKSIADAKASHTRLMHTCTYIGTSKKNRGKALVGYPDCVIFDEAHKLVDRQHEGLTVNLWRNKHHWPMTLSTAEDIIKWIDAHKYDPYSEERKAAKALICSTKEPVYISQSVEMYYNREEYVLSFKPLTARYAPPTLWPRSVNNVILMSATIGEKDVKDLGIDQYYDVKYIHVDSPIPPANRPLYYHPLVSVSHKDGEDGLFELAHRINQLLQVHSGSGVIHATYNDAKILRYYLTSDRYMWHTKDDKSDVLARFLKGPRGKVLIASGLAEGLDLAGDAADWQVITKIPYPSQADGFVNFKSQLDPEWYAWNAVKSLIQAYGRVSRGPDDYGCTYIFDERFRSLYDRYTFMFPPWFRDAIKWPV